MKLSRHFRTNQQDYWKHFGFIADPFVDINDNAHYIPNSWREYFELLTQFTQYCETLVLITGQHGIGKTTFIKQFIEKESASLDTLYIMAEECSGIEELLQLLHQHYDAPYEQHSQLLITDQLILQLNYLKDNKHDRLLVIDNANQLPLDVRQACLQIIQQQSSLNTFLPIILIGTPELEEHYQNLLTLPTAEECLHRVNMLALTPDETRDYLYSICENSGLNQNDCPFNNEDIETIYHATQGVISAINISARNLLIAKLPDTPLQFSFNKKKLLWWSGILMTIFIALFVYKQLTKPIELAHSFTQPIPMRDKQEAAKQPQTHDYQTGDVIVNTSSTTAPEPKKMPESKTVAKLKAIPKAKTAPATKTTSTDSTPAGQISENKILPIKPKQQKNRKSAVTKPLNQPTDASKDLFNTIMQQRLSIQKQRVLKIKPSHFTLQLLASSNLHGIQKFIMKYNLQATALVVKIFHKEKPLYIIIYGNFETRQQANVILLANQLKFKKLKPWLRSYKSIQTVMKKPQE